jgi:hypothetical protein
VDVEVLTGLPGCGKSYEMRQEAINKRGLYLFVYSSIDLIKEQKSAFEDDDAKSVLRVVEAHSEAPGSGSVQNRLERHQAYFEANGVDHAVVLMTHEGLMGTDLSAFSDWHVRIDEAPNTIQSGVVSAPASAALLKQMFRVEPVGSHGWGRLRPLTTSSGWRARAADDLLGPLAEMLKQADRDHGIFVDTLELKDSFGWCSIWPLASVAHCKSVKIAGASYPISLGAIVAKRWEGVTFRPQPILRPWAKQPIVRIHYFTQSHEGSTTFWKKRRGGGFIAKIADFLAAKEPTLGFWSANDEVKRLLDHRLSGKPISAKSAGLNVYDDETSCALIYSSKVLPGDKPAQALFDITDGEILRAREEEDILQFVMRGAIRRRDFDGDYDIYLYSKRQAELVAQKLMRSGIGKSVSLVPEPGAGIMDAHPQPMKAIRQAIASEKKSESRAAYKEREALRKQKSRALKALAEGRAPGQVGRAKGSKDKTPRKPRAKS